MQADNVTEQEEGNVKYMLFSATFPTAVRQLAKNHLAESHVRIRVGRVGSTHKNIRQDIVYVAPELKKQALIDLLFSMKPGRTIVLSTASELRTRSTTSFGTRKCRALLCTPTVLSASERMRCEASEVEVPLS